MIEYKIGDIPLSDYPWFQALDQRQQSDVRLSLYYTNDLNHGTSNHGLYILIARLAGLLSSGATTLKTKPEFMD